MNTKLNLLLALAFILIGSTMTEARDYEIKDYLNPDNPDRKAYIEKYKAIAMEEMIRNRIPASIKLAQGILESADGKSKLASNANNHFGMKCGNDWTGDTYYLKDDDYDSNGNLVKSCFRVYDIPEQSYLAHSKFLRNPEKRYRYGFLFDLDIKDYKAWAKGLKASGYATNPNYANLLIGIIEANQLYKYDDLTRIPIEFPEMEILPMEDDPMLAETSTDTDDDRIKNEVVMNNGLRMVFASNGDTPRSIGDFFGIKPKKLSKYNEFYESGRMPLDKGDRVYLQPKRKAWRGQEKTHKVNPGETMYDISQMYGVKLEKLYRRNRMTMGTEPASNQNIYVRGKRSRKDVVRLRKKSKYQPPSNNIPVTNVPHKPQVELVDGANVADVIRNKVRTLDMNRRIDAYAKITDGTYRPPTTTYTPPPTTTTPPRPVTTQPTHTGGSHPTPPPAIVTHPTHTGGQPTTTTPTSPPRPATTQPTPPPPPSPAPAVSYHTVESGETLYAISKKYNISIGQIKIWNGLSSNLISIGQQLRVR